MTDVTISALPVAASIADSDLMVVVEIGTPNVTKRATAAQMRAPMLPLTGGTVTGALTLNTTLSVGGASTFKDTATMDAGGGWSSSNAGKQLLITTPAAVSNPAIGITDLNGTNLIGLINSTGTLQIASMPAYSNGVTAPTVLASISKTDVTLAVATKVSSGGIAVTGNSVITGTLGGLTGLTVTGGSTLNGTVTVGAGSAQITGSSGTAVILSGTSTNDSAASGKIGEYIESNVDEASGLAITSGTPLNVTSLSLTAGDWDVCGVIGVSDGGSACTYDAFTGWVSSTSATAPTPANSGGYFRWSTNGGATLGRNQAWSLSNKRFSLSGSTTVYLTALINSTGSGKAYGYICARRAR